MKDDRGDQDLTKRIEELDHAESMDPSLLTSSLSTAGFNWHLVLGRGSRPATEPVDPVS